MEKRFIYFLNSSGSMIKEVAIFLHSAYKVRSAYVNRFFFIQILLLFNIMLNDISVEHVYESIL